MFVFFFQFFIIYLDFPIVKSGTNFEYLSLVSVSQEENRKPEFQVEQVKITHDIEKDIDAVNYIEKYDQKTKKQLNKLLAVIKFDGDSGNIR